MWSGQFWKFIEEILCNYVFIYIPYNQTPKTLGPLSTIPTTQITATTVTIITIITIMILLLKCK